MSNIVDEYGELLYHFGKADLLRKSKKPFNLSKNDVIVLRSIHVLGNGQPIKMNQIANHFNISPSAVSQFMRKFEKHDYIQRIVQENDRRSVYIKLTDLGEKETQRAFTHINKKLIRFIEEIGEEDAKTLLRILKKSPLYTRKEEEDTTCLD